MGEYARFNGEEVKIGTCEDMYYLRADQRFDVTPVPGSLNPADTETAGGIRFRFPWPDEDSKHPGEFKSHNRGQYVSGIKVPHQIDHYSVQFVAQKGFLVSLPCPEGPQPENCTYKIARNGYMGSVQIVQQAFRNNRLVLICQCGGCGAAYNVPTIEDAGSILEALTEDAANEEMAYRRHPENIGDAPSAKRLREIVRRIVEGYATELVPA